MVTLQGVRRWVMTAAITSITVSGAIYGAVLRSKQQFNQERKRLREASPEDMIAQLEAVRADLVMKKNELERKIADFQAKRIGKEQEHKTAK
ncbi:hypothetical protein CC78DRAFT_15726 [Lojkania enalia]|uniref:Uncharacterized protein n=1 Tax=Lojkania enalia TaxID=147567 RepID=A0A9P4KHD0_9PLEO|nr:hypothetical protein CC78DRAFT_15726 [Didymosphaeria enalia]